MTTTLERRLSAIERRMGVDTGSFSDFSDADLLAALEWLSTTLAEGGDQLAEESLAREDAEEAKLKAYYARPDVGRGQELAIEDGVRWPYLRARAIQWERSASYSGPRSARNPDELRRKIEAVLAMGS
jgi:hypothetical protein